MVQSAAPTVDAFLLEVAEDRIGAIRRLRDECRARFTGWDEGMKWGMPGYGPPGNDPLICFNNQKGYIALYIGQSTIDAHKAGLKGISCGKSCVRFRDPARIDFDLVGSMLSHAFHAKGGAA